MEDDHIHMLTLSPELPHLSLFGIFDGHGVCNYLVRVTVRVRVSSSP